MTRALPQNLEVLQATFDPKRIRDILPGNSFTLDGIEFVSAYLPDSTPERFYIVKNSELIAKHRELCRRFANPTIVELGIAEGGSTALMALDARPAKLVAVDLEPQPLEALRAFIENRGLTETVRPLYGIDQADRLALAAAVDSELHGAPIDLVIDDCSHQLGPTRASFETLFPRMRPGGLYVIEDWNLDHVMREAVAASLREQLASGDPELRESLRSALANPTAEKPRRPLSQLAIELVLARAGSGDIVAEVTVDEYWITVTRGPAALDPVDFRLDDAYTDHFQLTTW